MSPLTTFLSKLIGLFCILFSIAEATHRQATIDSVTALIHDPPLLLVFGIVWLIAGLALVLSHNVWSGGAPPIIITLVAWVTLIRALVLLLLSPNALAGLIAAVLFEQYFYAYIAIALALGLYLTYAGFSSRPVGTTSRPDRSPR